MKKITTLIATFLLLIAILSHSIPQAQALSCMRIEFEEQFDSSEFVGVIIPTYLIESDTEYGDSTFAWNVEVVEEFKGSREQDFQIKDSVWQSEHSKLEKDKKYLVFLTSDNHLNLCDYPRSLEGQPLTDEELDILLVSEGLEGACAPHICKDGTQHPACTNTGDPINYFVDPCHQSKNTTSFSDVSQNHPYRNANYLGTV